MDCNRPVSRATNGIASNAPRTLVEVFQEAVELYKDHPGLKVEDIDPNPPAKGEKPPASVALADWKTWSYQQYFEDCKTVAGSFIALGMQAPTTPLPL